MKLKYFFLFLLILLIVNSSLLIGTVRYVSKSGTSQPPYTSWATAADSIQKCINICSFGDTVYVANGTYQERIDMIPGLSLIGSGMDSCVIDTRQLSEPYYSMRTYDECYVKNFGTYCRNVSEGWAVYILNSTIEFCKIQEADVGFLISTYQSKSAIAYKNIIFNVQDGIICQGRPLISENIISANGFGLISQINSSPIYTNNTIVGDPCYKGFSSGFGIKSIVSGNLFIGYGNTAIDADANDSITNNIVIGKDGLWDTGIYGIGSKIINNSVQNCNYGITAYSNAIVNYNNLWGNTIDNFGFSIDSTNIFNDPMFVNEDSSDFLLQKYSPLIDAGNPNILDKDGSRSDIGLFGGPYGESYKYIDLAPRTPINLTALVDTNYITLNWNKNTEADTSFYKVYRDTVINFSIDSTKLVSSSSDTFYIQINPHNVTKYVYKVTCVDKQGNESEPSEEKVVSITGIEHYPQLTTDYRLYQNYPNPFNPSTTISYRLKERGYVKLYVYDIKGELVSVLVNKTQEAGFYQVNFSSSSIGNPESGIPKSGRQNLASGMYIYQLHVRGEGDIPVFTDMGKMILLK